MRFLDPNSLYALLLIVGIVVLYLLRMPRRKTTFPSTLILETLPDVARSKRMRRRLRTLISALLQILIMLFIVVACARPYVSTRGLANREIILLIDRSASMQTRDVKVASEGSGGSAKMTTRFEKAREAALGIVSDMDLGDRMLLMAFGSDAEVVANFAGSKSVLRQALETLQPLDTPTDITPAVELVREVTKALKHPEVYVVSDGAFDPEPLRDVKTAETSLFYTKVGQAKENVGITRFNARRILNSDQDFEMAVTVANNTKQAQSLDVEIYLNGKIKDVCHLEVGPDSAASEIFASTIVVGGALEARLAREDAFPVDNVAYEVVPLPRREKMLLISEDTENFLVPALRSNFGVSGYRLPPERYSPRYDVDVVIFYNYVPKELPDCHMIFVNSKGTGLPVELREQVVNPAVRRWDSAHPLMNYASLSNLFITSAKKLIAPEWLEPVAEGATTPLIVAGEKGTQKMVFIGFDPRHSDLPFRLAFPMFLSNCVQWFREESARTVSHQIRPCDAFRIALEDRAVETVTLKRPDGEEADLQLTQGPAWFRDTGKAGVYTYSTERGQEGAFAINLTNAQESQIAPRDTLGVGEQPFSLEDLEKEVWYNKKLWVYLGLLAVLLLAAEAYLYHQRIVF